jgi:DNA-binding protein Fis
MVLGLGRAMIETCLDDVARCPHGLTEAYEPVTKAPTPRPLLLVVDDEVPVLRVVERLAAKAGFDIESRPVAADSPVPLDTVERDHILEVLRQVNGNRMAAARILGISRRALYRRLERHNLVDEAPRPAMSRSSRDADRSGACAALCRGSSQRL